MIFALDFLNNRELCTPKLSCHLRISKSLIALLFRCSMNVSSRTRLRGDSGISKGTLALAGVYAASFAALCTTA